MQIEEFRKHAHELVDWMADYLANSEKYPVKSQVEPNEILNQLPDSAPKAPEDFAEIFADFQNIIIPGMTHWQSPNYFAYFTANASPPSILGEMLTSTLAAQCMVWQTSPAAAELEEQVMNWLKEMCGLPQEWSGVIQDTASTATLCSILTAREKISDYKINVEGITSNKYRIYCSSETHSSIDKAVKIAGLGSENIVKIEVDENLALIPKKLKAAIETDIKNGYTPLCVIATIGTTSTTAVDPVRAIGEICQKYALWYHVDAAYSGSAMVLEEMRWMIDGLELADTYVFNPHKWMFTNFDCSAYFVKDEGALIQTFEILPEYLKTNEKSKVNNYRDWGIQLGRRFRALKLWFVIRSYGVKGIQEKIRKHIDLAIELEEKINQHEKFELLMKRTVTLLCFRYKPDDSISDENLNELNQLLLENLNKTGQIFLTHTKVNGRFMLRLVISQTYVEKRHVDAAWDLIQKTASLIKS
ncbi:MAG: aminotransferase class V-fold PLP-dependent enzyme [Calditrichaeota bacterium]|nr:MAG: aminotransferase class V-fold PLP-dependent enzyme [Calditrichota bacterium]